MFDEAVVEMDSGNIVRLPELSARLTVGEKGPVRITFRFSLVSRSQVCRLLEYTSTSDARHAKPHRIPTRQREAEQSGHRLIR